MAFFGLFGEPDIERLERKNDVDGLIRALQYKKSIGVRSAAARALGDLGDARAVEPLCAVLGDEWD